MRLNMYSIFDTATGAYMRPFFMNSDGQALRAFSDLVNDAEHPIGQHPEDYSIARLGTWDDKTGESSPEPVQYLATGLEIQAQSRKVNSGNIAALEKEVSNG